MLKRHPIVPLPSADVEQRGNGFTYKGREYVHHSALESHEIALHRLSEQQIVFIALLFIVVCLSLILNWHTTLIVLVAVITVLYFADLLFNLFLIYRRLVQKSYYLCEEKGDDHY